jgi:hypothetical protein
MACRRVGFSTCTRGVMPRRNIGWNSFDMLVLADAYPLEYIVLTVGAARTVTCHSTAMAFNS